MPRHLFAALAAVAALALAFAGVAHGARGAGKLDGEYIVVLEGSAGDPDTATDDLQRKGGFRARLRFRRALRGFAARLSDQQVARLRDDPAVAAVTPDRPVKAFGEVALAAGDEVPSGVRRMAAAAAGNARESSGAKVAVIDSGIDLAHPDLNAAEGVNCVAPGTPVRDDDGHGTHVAGTISARNDGAGVAGIAPGTRTVAVKVLDAEGNGSFSQVICGIDWVTATRTDADPSNDIAVANMSLGGLGPALAPCATTMDPLHRAICASTRAGITYVVAAGNEGWEFDHATTPDLPAAYPEVLTVTAMSDSDGAPGGHGAAPTCRAGEVDDAGATFSNFAVTSAGAAHAIAAPGVCVRSTSPGGGFSTLSGTSMASPHIAGAVALCLSEGGTAGPCAGLSPAAIIARMRETAAGQGPAFGFAGDPARPVTGKYFGYLAWAGFVPGQTVAPAPVTPAPTSAGATGGTSTSLATSAPVAPAPAAADRTAPSTAISIARRRLSTVLRRGLAVALRCSEGCVAAVDVWLPGRTARRAGLSRGAKVRIARRSGVRLAANTRQSIVLRLSRTARMKLVRLRAVTVTVRVTVVDAAGNRRAVSRTVTIRR